MSDLKQKFSYSQGRILAQSTEDPDMKAGICSAICFDWVKRSLIGVKVSKDTYADPSYLFSQQRAIDYVAEHDLESRDKFWTKLAKRDKLTMTKVVTGHWIEGDYTGSADAVDELGEGVYLLGMVGHHAGHATTFHVTRNSKTWFDPNLGQYEGSGNIGASHSKILLIYKTMFCPGVWTLYKFSGVPRDAAWLKTNPGK